METVDVKIWFPTDSDEWHQAAGETLWAKLIDLSSGEYMVDNSPFFAKGVSLGDHVIAKISDGALRFKALLAASGHSTYRIIVDDKDLFSEFWKKLLDTGVTFEGGSHFGKTMFSIDIPPESDISMVYDILEKGETAGAWIFEEGNYNRSRSAT